MGYLPLQLCIFAFLVRMTQVHLSLVMKRRLCNLNVGLIKALFLDSRWILLVALCISPKEMALGSFTMRGASAVIPLRGVMCMFISYLGVLSMTNICLVYSDNRELEISLCV